MVSVPSGPEGDAAPPGSYGSGDVVTDVASLGRSMVATLRPGTNPVATAAALRAVGGAGIIALAGAALGDLRVVGLAYLGAACSVAFLTGGTYGNRLRALAAQGTGAVAGISMGVILPSSAVSLIAAAIGVGVVSGMVGTLGANAPGFGMMLSIGLAFGQFGGSSLPWWQQDLWYAAGTAVIAVATLSPWLFRRGVLERRAVAAVFAAAADVCAAAGTPAGRAARMTLAATSASVRSAGGHPGAEAIAFAAASVYAYGERVPAAFVAAIRDAGTQILAGEPLTEVIDVPPPDDAHPGLHDLANALTSARCGLSSRPTRRMGSVIRAALSRTAIADGARIGLCLGVATAITVAMHEPGHAFWLPLTVAVIVRPEYASVFVRTVNRVCGTVIGAAFAATVLWTYPSGFAVAIAAALALGFAVLTAPKLYALTVIGVTASALLSGSIDHVDPVLPGLRLLDTIIGAAVAIVFGYLLWPGARRLPQTARLDAALTAARAYLGEAVKPPEQRTRWQARRDDAYQLAHRSRAACQAAILEPPPVSSLAGAALAAATELEEVVDAITAVASSTEAGGDTAVRTEQIGQRLSRLDRLTQANSRTKSWRGQR
jgi:Fusaric acid resistance protein-like